MQWEQPPGNHRRAARRAAATATAGSNLGELERLTTTYPTERAELQKTLPNDAFVPEVHVDGPAAATSVLLLVLLLAISLDRILGLTDKLNTLALKWKEQRAYRERNEIIDARRELESLLGDDGDGGGSGEGRGGTEPPEPPPQPPK